MRPRIFLFKKYNHKLVNPLTKELNYEKLYDWN